MSLLAILAGATKSDLQACVLTLKLKQRQGLAVWASVVTSMLVGPIGRRSVMQKL